jgi:hypothetical protein
MRTFFTFANGLIGCVFLLMPSFAMAQTTGPATTATCAVLDDTCASVDSTFSPSLVKLTKASGWRTVKCVGTTANIPTTPATCSHATQGVGCTVIIGNRTLAITRWTESIAGSGSATMT